MPEPVDYAHAFLDSTYLKLDEGALGFIFGRERVARLAARTLEEARSAVAARRGELASVVAETARHILNDAYYMQLFERLSEMDEELALGFVSLCLQRVQDEAVEAARREVVQAIAAKRLKKPAH